MVNIVRKRQYNKGAAMVVSIIIIAVLMIFAFSLILISYNLYASQNKNIASIRNMEAANTLSISLQQEMIDENAWDESNLWNYVRFNLFDLDDTSTGAWPYYSPLKAGDIGYEPGHDRNAAVKEFRLDSNSGVECLPAETFVRVYWTLPDDISAADYLATSDPEFRMEAKRGARLFIEIQCNTGSQSYKVTEILQLDVEEMTMPDDEDKQNKLEIYYSNYISAAEYHERINRNEKWTWIHEARK